MKEKLKKLWLLNEGLILNVDYDFYVVKFDLLKDKDKVTSKGP